MAEKDSYNFGDLLPDFIAECDEHLTAARQLLIAGEKASDHLDHHQVGSLFRNFHTIKGLSGMVGVREAERVAHSLESYLGLVRDGSVALTAEGLNLLIDGTDALEQIIAACRDKKTAPNVDSLVERAARLLPSKKAPINSESTVSAPSPRQPAKSSNELITKISQARLKGLHIWNATFSPTAKLAGQGISVDVVRQRLQQAGEILAAEPVIQPGRGVSFNFVIAGPGEEFDTSARSEGLIVEPYGLAMADKSDVASPSRTVSTLGSSNLVRVDLGRLDDIMRTVGELVITRARLDLGLERVASTLSTIHLRELQETSQAIERQLRTLREGVMRVRLVPVRDVFTRMHFVVRDVARELGKEVTLETTGETTEIDKFVVERLADPLLHLVRNAVSHGIELPNERVSAGKPQRGRVTLRAAAAGGAVVIEVEDDGRGIDAERVFERARKRGLIASDTPTDPAGLLDLLCSPGFSTRETADHSSGRGVGMDVVRKAVEDLGGELALDSRPRLGTRFTARLPLTLAIADALIISVADQIYALPQAVVREVMRIEPNDMTGIENNELLNHRGTIMSLLRLNDLFGNPRPSGAFSVLIVGEGRQSIALAADNIIGLREIVVRPLADPLIQAPGFGGATELGNGRAVLILDSAALIRSSRLRRPHTALQGT